MDSSRDGTDDIRKIILQIGSKGAGAKCHAVVYIIHCVQHSLKLLLAGDDAWKSEHAPCRIIRMNCHLDVILVADRHDCLQEVNKVLEKLLLIDILVHFKQLLDVGHSLRLPARHHGSVHAAADGIEHVCGINCINRLLRVCQNSRAVRSSSCQLGSCPVEYRHEVIADHVDVFFSEILERLDIGINVLVAICASGLDCVRNVDRLDAADVQSGSLYLFLQSMDLFLGPELTRLLVIKHCNNSGYVSGLSDLFESNGVKFGTVPAHCHFHSRNPLS